MNRNSLFTPRRITSAYLISITSKKRSVPAFFQKGSNQLIIPQSCQTTKEPMRAVSYRLFSSSGQLQVDARVVTIFIKGKVINNVCFVHVAGAVFFSLIAP